VLAHRTYCNCGDGAQAAVREAVDGCRGQPHRRPGAPDRWNKEKARFVYEGYVGLEPLGVFLALGQSFLTQSAILSSER